jgi:hypothetical protein
VLASPFDKLQFAPTLKIPAGNFFQPGKDKTKGVNGEHYAINNLARPAKGAGLF